MFLPKPFGKPEGGRKPCKREVKNKMSSNIDKTLQRQAESINGQISELKAELAELNGGPVDPVLNRFLKKRLGFDYAAEKEALERQVRQIKWQLKELEHEKAKLEPQISEEAFKQEFLRRGIRFIGQDVEGFDYTLVKFKCSKCGHRFSQDLRNHGSFNNVWACSTDVALQQVYAMKYNRVWPLNCEKCHAELDVWITRERL
jgi:chaperonin cofactor prefoldin